MTTSLFTTRERSGIFTALVLTSLSFAAASCAGSSTAPSYSAADIINQNPKGNVGEDAAWSMGTAYVRENTPGTLSVTLYGETVANACGFASSNRPSVLFSIPKVVGDYPLKLSFGSDSNSNRTLTFVKPPASNTISANGLLRVESIDGNSVTISLVADAGANRVNGRFTATVCGS